MFLFFLVVHKMSSSELPNLDPVRPLSSSTSAAPTVKERGRNRRLDDSDPGVDCETEAAPSHHQGGHHLSFPDYEFEDKGSEECHLPQNKTRNTESSLLPDDSPTPFHTWTQDSPFTCSQFPEREFDPNDKNDTKKTLENSERSFLDSPESEEFFGSLTSVEGRTSTQIPDELHPQVDDEKENRRSLNSPKKHYSVSHLGLPGHKQAESKSTSLKRTDGRRSSAGSEAHFDSTTRSKLSGSLQKAPQRNRKADENSCAALFTQDSEGFRVIAHRGPPTRSPLRDESNVSSAGVRSCPYKYEDDEEEDEMLFTQDSQGNMVIKH